MTTLRGAGPEHTSGMYSGCWITPVHPRPSWEPRGRRCGECGPAVARGKGRGNPVTPALGGNKPPHPREYTPRVRLNLCKNNTPHLTPQEGKNRPCIQMVLESAIWVAGWKKQGCPENSSLVSEKHFQLFYCERIPLLFLCTFLPALWDQWWTKWEASESMLTL